MTSLEKIVKQIEEEAAMTASAKIEEANLQAKEIKAASARQLKEKLSEIEAQGKRQQEECLKRAQSAALLHEKKLILEEKQRMIASIIEDAQTSLLNQDEEAYFTIIKKMVQKYALGQSGEIIFSESDRKRLTEQREQEIITTVQGIKGASLTISKKSRNIEGGFILLYGEVEVNCSFRALFLSAKDSLQDMVCRLLFE